MSFRWLSTRLQQQRYCSFALSHRFFNVFQLNRPTPSGVLQITWLYLGTRPSSTTMLYRLWVLCHINYITQHLYHVKVIKQTIFEIGKGISDPLVSLMLMGSFPHGDNALSHCSAANAKLSQISIIEPVRIMQPTGRFPSMTKNVFMGFHLMACSSKDIDFIPTPRGHWRFEKSHTAEIFPGVSTVTWRNSKALP